MHISSSTPCSHDGHHHNLHALHQAMSCCVIMIERSSNGDDVIFRQVTQQHMTCNHSCRVRISWHAPLVEETDKVTITEESLQ